MQPNLYKKQLKSGSAQPIENTKIIAERRKCMNNKFSENIKKIRKENNLSQEELAEQLGVSRQAISKWESSIAYPEMDKIIQICDNFGVNIDDLLHKDIKEVKGEEVTKNKLNKYIEDFFAFITDTVRLFENMNFKSKCKCLFEQSITVIILVIVFVIIYAILDTILYNSLGVILHTTKAYYIISSVVFCIYFIFAIVCGFIILVHIFNIRYLEYFKNIKEDIEHKKEKNNDKVEQKESDNEPLTINEQNKIAFKNNKQKIIIRDPNHSEYNFLNGLMKLTLAGVKFCAIWLELGLCISLLFIVACAVASFLIVRTGLFFIGIFLGLISLGILNTIIVLLLFNFIFNRKNNKKVIIWSSIISTIIVGISCGLIAIGAVNFDIEKYQEKRITQTLELEMDDNLYVDNYMDMNRVEFYEENRNNLRIEYDTYEGFELKYYITGYGNLHIYAEEKNPFQTLRRVINDINNKKFVAYYSPLYDTVRIYTSKENIEKIKNNYNNHYDFERQQEETIEEYEERIENLENELEESYQKIDSLEEKLDEYHYIIESLDDDK